MLTRCACIALVTIVAALGAGTIAFAESPAAITLAPGRNVVIWAGSEPYAIAHLQGTPVSQVHRWDPATQTYLSHYIGQDRAALPEQHLLPRVQYLLVAEAAYELTIPDPLADVDPYAELRTPPPPDAPLRFDAVWPNEYSPLDDLVVLRGDDQFLSVRARVADGVGETSVWWMIDGGLNHEGLVSNHVDLLPGGHDYGLVYAADESGQVAVAELPRIVRLQPLAMSLTEPKYGVVAHFNRSSNYGSIAEIEAAAELIKEAGMSIVRMDLGNYLTESGRLVEWGTEFDNILEIVHKHELQVLAIIGGSAPSWATSKDKGSQWNPWAGVSRYDSGPAQMQARLIARRWPNQVLFEIGNEPNLSTYGGFVDPHAWGEHHKAVALGIYYENPSAIIVSAGICCFGWFDTVTRLTPFQDYPGQEDWIEGPME